MTLNESPKFSTQTKRSIRKSAILFLKIYTVILTLIMIPYRFLVLFSDHPPLALFLLGIVLVCCIFAIMSKRKTYLVIYSSVVTIFLILALTGWVFIPYTF
jgi:cytochrome bd-type quinol oxidase subunit 2